MKFDTNDTFYTASKNLMYKFGAGSRDEEDEEERKKREEVEENGNRCEVFFVDEFRNIEKEKKHIENFSIFI